MEKVAVKVLKMEYGFGSWMEPEWFETYEEAEAYAEQINSDPSNTKTKYREAEVM